MVDIKGVKVPLINSGRKKELLEIQGNGKIEIVELPHLNKQETKNLYPCRDIEIPPNNEVNVLLKMRRKEMEKENEKIETL